MIKKLKQRRAAARVMHQLAHGYGWRPGPFG